jgi:soluble lytic murein transglycosylase-like protein
MANPRHRWLILVVVTAVIAVATSAAAQVRTRPVKGSSYQQVAYASSRLGQGRSASSPRDHGAYTREIAEASSRYAVPERLIWAVIRVESGFDHRAVSARGARGLMQLMPETAAILGVRDPFNPRENIDGGTRHLRAMMVRFRYDVRLAVAAYNAGERPVAVHGGVPPYPETRDYVAQVLRYYNAPGDWRPTPGGNEVRRFVEPSGTIVYTNIRYGQISASAHGR